MDSSQERIFGMTNICISCFAQSRFRNIGNMSNTYDDMVLKLITEHEELEKIRNTPLFNKSFSTFNKEVSKKLARYLKYAEEDAKVRLDIMNSKPARFKSRLISRFQSETRRALPKLSPEAIARSGIDFDKVVNYLGPSPGRGYEIDHIVPLSLFDLSDESQLKIAFMPENHRWLLKSKNRHRRPGQPEAKHEIKMLLSKYGYRINEKANKIEKMI